MFSRRILGGSFIIILLALAQQAVMLSSCANIIPPVGGARDSLPPAVTKMNPGANAVNVTTTKIELEFDEYLQRFDNARENLVISPLPVKAPDIDVRLNKVIVKLRDSLEPNTTYTIDFGNGIRDVNESNVLRNFRYVFSTGPAIDSLQLNGKVILAETGKIDTTLIVGLYRDLDDSAVYKNAPRYVTKLDANGAFRFRNLPPGRFNIYAFQDEGAQKRYISETQVFSFFDQPVTTGGNTKQDITLYAYAARKEASGPPPPAAADVKLRVISSSLESGMQDILSPLTVDFNKTLKTFDTAKLVLADTLNQKIPGYVLEIDSNRRKLTLNYKWQPGADYRILVQKDFATDDRGNTLLRNDTIKFRAKPNKEYGKVRIKFDASVLPASPVLQILLNGVIIRSIPVVNRQVDIAQFRPGEYDLRLLNDENGNGIWDPGTFFAAKKKQPEKVTVLTKRLSVRGDWENELNIE